jgi:uncharacterized membrane protein YcaP (DUF421 family)
MITAGAETLVQTLAAAVLAYAALVAFLRISGKRTLAKWNAFDLVVTVALGSSLATAILSRDVPVMQGALAFAVLIALQYAVTWSSVRWRAVERFVKSEPVLLVFEGRLDEPAMKRSRVTREEIDAALRSQGIARAEDAAAVVLETEGSISIIKDFGGRPPTVLGGVLGFPRPAEAGGSAAGTGS